MGEPLPGHSDTSSMADDIWQRLEVAGLIRGADGERLRVAASQAGHHDTQAVLAWLMKQSVVTQYQALLLANGYDGTFGYGDYRLTRRIDVPERLGQFEAVHLPTGHPVLLDFLPAGHDWPPERLSRLVKEMPLHIALQHAGLTDCHQLVVLPEYRFLVSERPPGRPLALPASPLPLATTLRQIAQLADAVQALHERGLVHGAIRPGNLSRVEQTLVLARYPLRQSGPLLPVSAACRAATVAQLPYAAAELLEPGQPPTVASDLYAIGCLLWQLLTGSSPFSAPSLQALRQQHAAGISGRWAEMADRFPPPLVDLLRRLLAKTPAARGSSCREISAAVAALGAAPSEPAGRMRLATSAVFEQFLASHGEVPAPVPPRDQHATASLAPSALADLEVRFADTLHERRCAERHRRRILVPCLAALLAATLFIAWRWLMQPIEIPTVAKVTLPPRAEIVPVREEPAASYPAGQTTSGGPAAPVDERFVTVADDGHLLWARPTSGSAFEFTYAPQGCQLFLIWRPREVMASPARQVLAGLGPEALTVIERWQQELALPLERIEQAAIYVAPDAEGRPEAVSQLMLLTSDDRPDAWSSGSAETAAAGVLLRRGDLVCYVPAAGQGRQLIIGSEAVVREIAERRGQPPALRREFEALRRMSDRDCQCSLLWAPSFLLYDGREMLLPGYRQVPAIIDRFCGDGVRAMLFSVHVTADESFGELRLETTNARRRVMLSELTEKITSLADRGESFLSSLPEINEHWRPMALRMRGMLGYLSDHTRIAMEARQLVLNASLPSAAAQNLTLAAELSLAATAGHESHESADPRTGPPIRSIEDLLSVRTSLSFPQQSLEFALRDLAADVNAAVVGAPFPLRIEISGSDLQQEGITRNQQIRDFRGEEQTVAELLTALLLKANPITTVQRANESDQRLVWTVQSAGPRQNGPFVLVTTRQAAKDRGLELPPVFQEE